MTKKSKRIVLALIFIAILGLMGLIVYSFQTRPVYHLESEESIESLESNQILDNMDVFPLDGDINHHYIGIAETTKSDGINLDQIEVILLNNNKFIIIETFGTSKTEYIGLYEKQDTKYNLYVKYKATNCTKEEYNPDVLEIFINMDESIYYEEINSNPDESREVIKLIDDENHDIKILDDYLCLN